MWLASVASEVYVQDSYGHPWLPVLVGKNYSPSKGGIQQNITRLSACIAFVLRTHAIQADKLVINFL